MSEATENRNTVHQGKNIRFSREFKGLSQEELAFKINKHQSDISRIENQIKVDDEILEQIALALEVSADFLKKFDFEDAAKNYNNNSSYLINDEAHDNKLEQNQIEVQENIYYPIEEFKELTEKTINLQRGLLEKNHKLDKENALLKQQLELLKNK
ncbi:MAG: helix-turn-helix domain-containing protein [Prevotella sp.]|nr:helix-turn-helix domain-containing protein [Prevotella sp.]